jgi:hypothetical protein
MIPGIDLDDNSLSVVAVNMLSYMNNIKQVIELARFFVHLRQVEWKGFEV